MITIITIITNVALVSILQSLKPLSTSLVDDQKQQVYRAARRKSSLKVTIKECLIEPSLKSPMSRTSLNLNQYIIDNHIKAGIELDLLNLV